MEKNYYKISKAIFKMTVKVLIIQIVLGLVLPIFDFGNFYITGGDKSVIFTDDETTNFLLIITGIGLLVEMGLMLVLGIICYVIPVITNIVLLIINGIARLFQIGEYKKWKNNITIACLYIGIAVQVLMNLYLILLLISLIVSGYVSLYAGVAVVINMYGLVKNFKCLRAKEDTHIENPIVNPQIM